MKSVSDLPKTEREKSQHLKIVIRLELHRVRTCQPDARIKALAIRHGVILVRDLDREVIGHLNAALGLSWMTTAAAR